MHDSPAALSAQRTTSLSKLDRPSLTLTEEATGNEDRITKVAETAIGDDYNAAESRVSIGRVSLGQEVHILQVNV